MAQATHILQRPAQFQWDSNSRPCQSTNCNPTSGAMVIGYYKDAMYSPTLVRRYMQRGSNACGGTNNSELVRGMTALGVPASTAMLTATQVKTKLNAAIPVVLSVNYGKIPANKAYRTDMAFSGMHAVVACSTGTAKDHLGRLVPGIWVRDPDHGSPSRPERPDKTFWPDWVWVPAHRRPGFSGGISVFPKYAKKVAAPVQDPTAFKRTCTVAYNNVRLRDDPTTISKIIAEVDSGYRFVSALYKKNGGVYTANGVRRTDWIGFERSGNMVWVAAAYVKVSK